jgi:hypothetical protein
MRMGRRSFRSDLTRACSKRRAASGIYLISL